MAEHNQVERKNVQSKGVYGLNDISARLSLVSNSWIGAIFLLYRLNPSYEVFLCLSCYC